MFEKGIYVIQNRVQFRTVFSGHAFKAPDHSSGIKENPYRLGTDIGQPEWCNPPKFFFDIRYDIQKLGIGIQKYFEMDVLFSEGGKHTDTVLLSQLFFKNDGSYPVKHGLLSLVCRNETPESMNQT
jgi:hypothetical protein